MVPAVLEHNFSGTPFTLGIEEELMICDAETLELSQSIETILGDLPGGAPRRGEAGADAVRARGGDPALPRRR